MTSTMTSVFPAPTPHLKCLSTLSSPINLFLQSTHSGSLRLRRSQTLGWDAEDTRSYTWHPVHPVGCNPAFGPPTHSPFSCGAVPVNCLPFCWHPEGLPATQTADGQEKRAGAHITQRKNECNGQTMWSERRVADTWLLVR